MAFRLLLDSAFPEPTTGYSRPGIVLDRWHHEDLSDTQLVAAADKDGYQAVAFVGPEVLARDEVIDAAIRAGISLVITTAADPLRAQRDIVVHLPSVGKAAGRGRLVWVTAHGVRKRRLRIVKRREP